ncbi:MAG: hypothetical protein KAS30_02760 [Candidatus Diapherotrites archaeon]|nr:hypothetical protein [Candidatus Diapherotrites archaeon]
MSLKNDDKTSDLIKSNNKSIEPKKWVFDRQIHKTLFLKSSAIFVLGIAAGFLVSSLVIHTKSQTDKCYTALASALPQTVFFDLTAFLSMFISESFSIATAIFIVNISMIVFLMLAGPITSIGITKLFKSIKFNSEKTMFPVLTPEFVQNFSSRINSLMLFVFPATHLLLSGFFLGYFIFVDAVFNSAEFTTIYLGAIPFLVFELTSFFNATAYALAPFKFAQQQSLKKSIFSVSKNYFLSTSFAKVLIVSIILMVIGAILESVFLIS